MSDVMKDVIDPPASAVRRSVARQVAVSVLLSVACSVPITLAVVRSWGPSPTPEPFVQGGNFMVVAGQEGAVNFPIPYEYPPGVETSASGLNKTIVAEITPHGFRWKNSGPSDIFNNTTLEWTAKGVPIRRP